MANYGTCSVEVGLFKKKPCGSTAVAECLNCSQPICSAHAIAEVNDLNKKTGKFLCKECSIAMKDQEKNIASSAKDMEARKRAAAQKAADDAAKASFGKPPPDLKKAGAPGAAPAAPAAAAGAKPATPAAPAPKEDLGALEFTPSKKPDGTK